MEALDRALPEYDVRERHRRRVDGDARPAVERILAAPAAPDAVTRLLLRLRRVPGRNGSVRDLLHALGGREVAPGVFRITGRITIAVAFWADGDVVRTETRVLCRDRRARRAFRLYWLAIRPFSGLIRRRWLRA